jgi:SNF2 family DNA or RNA helicase
MNNLEKLKQKLMVKPNVQERERVAVIIKGEKKTKIPQTKKITEKSIAENIQEGVINLTEQISQIQKIEGILPTKVDVEQREEEKEQTQQKQGPLIVDETQKGYDRNALLKKIAENKKNIVTIKEPITEAKITFIEEKIPQPKGPTKIKKKMPLIIEEDDEVKEKEESPDEFIFKNKAKVEEKEESPEEFILKKKKEKEVIIIKPPKKVERKTEKIEKGVAILGPEVNLEIGDTDLTKRLPKKSPPIIIKVGSYIMNNREIFVNFINSLFEPYKRELEANKESISCDNIGKTSSGFSLLTHQKIVRDYMNLYTPYRGLLLYHGLGSGKTCTSIAIAEGMKDSKNIIIMTPASLRANYMSELKKCGDLFYKKNQFWEWISVVDNPESLKTISSILNLPQEYIKKNEGAFFINVTKPSNYDELSDINKQILDQQLNEMIKCKYKFINYNGLRRDAYNAMKSNKNIFDNSVVIIDEAHNLISRIVNQLKKMVKPKNPDEEEPTEKEDTGLPLSVQIYKDLLSANNARIILLSGTPVVNYPNELGILFNILRGYIKTWEIPLVINTNKKIDNKSLRDLLMGEKSLDYLDYSPSGKKIIITRNPFAFKNKIKKESGYQGVSDSITNVEKTCIKEDKKTKQIDDNIKVETDYINDDDFQRKIISILKRNDIDIIPSGIKIKFKKALPDTIDRFIGNYVDETTGQLKNVDSLKRRMLGLSSYFRSAQESLLPRYNKQLGVDHHIVKIEMSDLQFKLYESMRKEERKLEKKPKSVHKEEQASTYRIFSRLVCNFAIPDRPIPEKKKKKDEELKEEDEKGIMSAIKEGTKAESKQDLDDPHEGEIEGDEVLENIGGTTYMERLKNKMKEMEENSNDFFTPEALQNYSPKFLNILENIQDPEYSGLHLLYSQFRTAEGIGLFTLVLNKNGFTQFKIKKNSLGIWEINIPEEDQGKPTYGLYTGTETVEEKEIIRHIYNGEWDDIPDSISNVLKSKYRSNNMGEVIKIFMITSSGSEGLNLRNTRYVHLMDPYWHPARSEQVIGRARRICSHKDLPLALQTVEVFIYLMVFSENQLKSDEAIELKRKDLSKAIPKIPLTSDQYLFEISELKYKLSNQMMDAIKESAFDCYIYSNGKCVNFGDPSIDKFSYVPDYSEQQNDTTVQANKIAVEWKGKPITVNHVEYVYRRINSNLLNIYDKKSYEAALTDPNIVPVQIGTLEKNERGEQVFKQLVTK